MRTLVFCACLILVVTPGWSFLVKENSVEITSDEGDVWPVWDKLFAAADADDDSLRGGNCDARRKEKSSCSCKANYCGCCLEESIFKSKKSEVCIGIIYIEDGDNYNIIMSQDRKILYNSVVDKQNLKDLTEKVTDQMEPEIEAELVLAINCQKVPGKREVSGCVAVSGNYKDKKTHKDAPVKEDFGCFTLEY